MTWTPHATVAVIVEDDQGRFLMVEEHSHGQIVYNQPAGHVEENERILDAALRETLEETGWKVRLDHFLGMYTYRAPANGVTYYRFCFTATALSRATDKLDSDIIAAHWLTWEELTRKQQQLRSPLVLQCIEDYRNGREFPLDVIVEPQTPSR
ncbi:NUDIX hydrolase [Marinobacter sp. CHS3-4]|uniref:NUDIX hydrolase n=1 Tax=Marinobacter sp. CHS3-4 TaxID=3045174 RepID=UPI0024B4A29D|nr:NUDIX hydrolase [Marinobacter sp. CHS3-4]MDI9245694.1 NUDIX hydrolase [Marinobacter sp. CHS3-4]